MHRKRNRRSAKGDGGDNSSSHSQLSEEEQEGHPHFPQNISCRSQTSSAGSGLENTEKIQQKERNIPLEPPPTKRAPSVGDVQPKFSKNTAIKNRGAVEKDQINSDENYKKNLKLQEKGIDNVLSSDGESRNSHKGGNNIEAEKSEPSTDFDVAVASIRADMENKRQNCAETDLEAHISLPSPLPERSRRQSEEETQPGAYQATPGTPGFTRNSTFRWINLLFSTSSSMNSNSNSIPQQQQSPGNQAPQLPLEEANENNTGNRQTNNLANEIHDSDLVSALPITDAHDDDKDVPHAIPEPEGEDPKKNAERKRNQTLFYLKASMVFGIGLLLAFMIGLIVRSQRREKPPVIVLETRPPTTQAPSLAPTPFVVDFLPEYSQRAILGNGSSPQAKAYQWLQSIPNITDYDNSQNVTDYDEFRILQRFALATIYYALDGENWHDSEDWLNHTVHECNWFPSEIFPPLDCSTVEEYLQIQFRNNSLQGDIPAEIGLLTSLTFLDLGHNAIKSLPSEIGLLTNLRTLLLNDNVFDSPIPTELGLLTSLVTLHLRDNNFQSTIPTELSALTNLVELELQRTKISGTIFTEIGHWQSLRIWKAQNTLLGGTIPSEIGRMSSLSELGIFNTNFTGTIPSELGNLKQLQQIQLDYNDLTGKIPSEFGMLGDSMFSLSFGGNLLTSTLPTELAQLSGLRTLRFFQNRLTGVLPTVIGRMTFLDRIELDDNGFFGPLPSELGSLRNMQMMFLGKNLLTGRLPSEIGRLAYLTHLTLNNNKLTGPIPEEWDEMAEVDGLQELFLGGNDITGTIPFGLCTVNRFQIDCDADICNCDCGFCV